MERVITFAPNNDTLLLLFVVPVLCLASEAGICFFLKKEDFFGYTTSTLGIGTEYAFRLFGGGTRPVGKRGTGKQPCARSVT